MDVVINSAITSSWISLARICEQAKAVVLDCIFTPEVHDHSEVVWIWPSSVDVKILKWKRKWRRTSMSVTRASWSTWTSPKHITTIFCCKDVAAFATKDSVKAKTTNEVIVAITTVHSVIAIIALYVVITFATIKKIITFSSDDCVVSMVSINGVVSILTV